MLQIVYHYGASPPRIDNLNLTSPISKEELEMKKFSILAAVLLVLIMGAVTLAYPGQVQISSHQIIPVIDGLFRMGPSTGFPVPFTVTQTFDVPPGATKAYGTIALGPCQAARFIGATPGYTSGDYPTQACSWIMWDPVPDTVTVTVEYNGNWTSNYIAFHQWEAWEGNAWVPYCLIGEPTGGQCPASLYLEAQPATTYLPIILRGA